MRSGIYFILNKISLKLYIGSAVYFARRKSEHFTRLSKNIHHNEHLQRAYNKHGAEAFEFIIIELAPVDKLIELETYYIAKHKATEEEFGYNKCPFGVSAIGRKHSAETIDKIRNSNKGKIVPEDRRLKISAALTGKKFSPERVAELKSRRASPETKAKMSASRKARLTANPELVVNAANARWKNREPLILTQPPINAKDYI